MTSIGLFARGLLCAGLLTALPVTTGCGKKDVPNPAVDDKTGKKGDDTAEKKPADKPTDKSDKKPDEKKVEAGDKKPTGATGYVRGEVLKYMPKDCATAKVFIDIGVLLKNESLQANWSTLFDKLVGGATGKDGDTLKKALDSLKKSGLEPAKDVREIAICVRNVDGDELVIGLGGNFQNAPKKIVDALNAMGDKKASVTESDGLKTTKMDDVIPVAFPSDSVLLIATVKDGEAVLKAAKKGEDRASEYGAAPGTGLSIKAEVRGNKFTIVLADKGGDLEFKTVVDLSEAELKEIKKTPAEGKLEFERKLKDFAAHFLKSPLSAVASDIDKAKVDVDGNKITVTFVVTGAHLAESLKKGAEDPDAVRKALH